MLTSPFEDLPAALLDEILGNTTTVARKIVTSFNKVAEERDSLRAKLVNSGMLMNEAALGLAPPQSTCAADGSYAIERLLATDLAVAAAVVVEGLAAPSETIHWERPRHRIFVASEPHFQETPALLGAVMLGEELRLLAKAPHDLPMLDGTIALPIIRFNVAANLSRVAAHLNSAHEFIGNCRAYLEAYLHVLKSNSADKQYVALPKYSTRREIGVALDWPASYDDRGILSILLNEGELTRPRTLDCNNWRFDANKLPRPHNRSVAEIADEVLSALEQVHVIYYKPRAWLPAYRIEYSKSITTDTNRLAAVVQGIKQQTVTPSMLEPFPIYLADRTVKAVARSVPAFRQVTTQRIAEEYDGDIEEVFYAMNGYRRISGM